jgi:hypothetical protein
MEIDLEGEFVEGDGANGIQLTKARVRWIELHIPYPSLGPCPERDYFPIATAIARFVGWKLYDLQTDQEIPG